MKTIPKKLSTIFLACVLCLSMTAQEVIRTVLPMKGQEVEVLAIDLPSDTAETHEKWTEFSWKKGQFTSDMGTATGKEALNGTLAHVGDKREGLVQYKVMIVPMPEQGSAMSIALKSLDGEFIPKMDETSLSDLRLLLEEFSTYVKTGFMKEDAVPEDNMPENKIKGLRPIE